MLLSISELIGRFHPVLVHLPIGILILALVFLWLNRNGKYETIAPAIKIALLLGAISAVASCISGLCLASGGEYDEDTLYWHKWMGLSVALVSSLCYIFFSNPGILQWQKRITYTTASALFFLIFITGHLGGTLTHGEGFLTQPLQKMLSDTVPLAKKKIIPNVQEAAAYNDIVQPLLQNKCYGCHSSVKQKGGLRLDTREWIVKGGKDGEVLSASNAEKSELYKRLMLDPLEEHHMPPKGKPQPTESEINLLHWWIASGASFEKKVKELDQPDKIKPILVALQSDTAGPKINTEVPTATVEKASDSALSKLRALGIVILPVGTGTNYLSVNFVSSQISADEGVKLLEPISNQLIWLKLTGSTLSDTGMRSIAKLTALIKLSLDRTQITDKGLASLQPLTKLQYLNLVGTGVTKQGLLLLKSLTQLKSLYLYQTKINRSDWSSIQSAFPKAKIDSGGYTVPSLATDTAIVREMPRKKT